MLTANTHVENVLTSTKAIRARRKGPRSTLRANAMVTNTQQHSLCDAPHDVIKFIILVVHFDRDGAARQLDVCALRAVYSVCAYGIRWYHLCSEGGP